MYNAFDSHEELVLKAARMLAVCRRARPDDALAEHVKTAALAVAIFKDMRSQEAMKFIEDNWEEIEKMVFTIDVLRDLDDLENA